MLLGSRLVVQLNGCATVGATCRLRKCYLCTMEIQRSIEVPAPTEEVWEALTAPDLLEEWLGEEVDVEFVGGGAGTVVDKGVVRHVEVETVEPGRRIGFRWWPDDRVEEATDVELVVMPLPGGSRIVVTETLVAGGTLALAA